MSKITLRQNLENLKTNEISYGFYEIEYLGERIILRNRF